MGAVASQVIKVLLQVLAGVGVGSVLDKVAADKVPNYTPALSEVVPGKPGFNPLKFVALAVFMVIGFILVTFIGKKFKIKSLK